MAIRYSKIPKYKKSANSDEGRSDRNAEQAKHEILSWLPYALSRTVGNFRGLSYPYDKDHLGCLHPSFDHSTCTSGNSRTPLKHLEASLIGLHVGGVSDRDAAVATIKETVGSAGIEFCAADGTRGLLLPLELSKGPAIGARGMDAMAAREGGAR